MSKQPVIKKLSTHSIEGWRKWLMKNHDKEEVIWLVFRKKSTGRVPFDYQMALDEALCFGWVDSLLNGSNTGASISQGFIINCCLIFFGLSNISM